MQALLKDDWKLVRFVGKHEELYNLKEYPGEQHDVYAQNPKMTKLLKKLMDKARNDPSEFPLVKVR